LYRIIIYIALLLPATILFADSHRPLDFLASIAGAHDEGEQIVRHYCANCHAVNPLIPLGAPRQQIPADWEARVRQGMSILLQHTAEGLRAMPARGGCFECTDEQLLLAVLAMLPPTSGLVEHKKDNKIKILNKKAKLIQKSPDNLKK